MAQITFKNVNAPDLTNELGAANNATDRLLAGFRQIGQGVTDIKDESNRQVDVRTGVNTDNLRREIDRGTDINSLRDSLNTIEDTSRNQFGPEVNVDLLKDATRSKIGELEKSASRDLFENSIDLLGVNNGNLQHAAGVMFRQGRAKGLSPEQIASNQDRLSTAFAAASDLTPSQEQAIASQTAQGQLQIDELASQREQQQTRFNRLHEGGEPFAEFFQPGATSAPEGQLITGDLATEDFLSIATANGASGDDLRDDLIAFQEDPKNADVSVGELSAAIAKTAVVDGDEFSINAMKRNLALIRRQRRKYFNDLETFETQDRSRAKSLSELGRSLLTSQQQNTNNARQINLKNSLGVTDKKPKKARRVRVN